MTRKRLYICLILAGLLIMVASGCIEPTMMYHSNPVSPDLVVALQESGAASARWETFDLIINFESIVESGVFEISGQANLGEHYQENYGAISHLIVYFFFLDKNSKVLAATELAYAVGSDPGENLMFSQRLNVPIGSAGLSFGYEGTAYDFERMTTFTQLPVNKE